MRMIWIITALLVALFSALSSFYLKKALNEIDEYLATWSWVAITFLFLLPILFFIEIPTLNNAFWFALIANVSINVFAFLSLSRALKISDISLVMPLLALTPLFMLVTSPIMISEFPNNIGLIGIVFVVAGAYILNINNKTAGYLDPFKSLLTSKGPRYALITAFIWSIGANLDKIAVTNSSILFYSVCFFGFITVGLTPFLLKSKNIVKQISSARNVLIIAGFFDALMMIFQMISIQLTLVNYVIAIKRLSGAISVLLGFWLLKEKGFKERLIGSFIMFMGVLFIALS